MTLADRIDGYRTRCEPGLLRLQVLAGGEAGVAIPRCAATEVRIATNEVIAGAEAASRAALAATTGARGELETETFLWVRLARLAEAADEAVRSARVNDAGGMRRHLHRFGVLVDALWEVQHAVYGQAFLPQCEAMPPRRADGTFCPTWLAGLGRMVEA
jgi:hypothetical protein